MKMELRSEVKALLRWFLQLPIVRELHARGLLAPILLGLVVVGFLVEGALTHQEPNERPAELAIPLPPIDAPTLRPELEKTPLTYVSDYWLQLGELVKNKLVLLGPQDTPGIVVAPGVALTSIRAASEALRQRRQEQASGENEGAEAPEASPASGYRVTSRLLGIDVELGLALFAIKQPRTISTFVKVELAKLPPGSYVAAVSLSAEQRVRITPGTLVSLRPAQAGEAPGTHLDLAIPFPEAFPTAAIVDLDGRLVGVAVRTTSGREIFAVDAIPPIVDRLATGGVCQAIEVGALSDEARKLLGVRGGVAVERVRGEAFVPEPSIREGDILLSWNRQNVAAVEEFNRLYEEAEPGALIRYRVLRNRRVVSGATRMPGGDCRPVPPAPEVFPQLGLTLEWNASGWKVVGVAGESPAFRADIVAGDMIVGAGGKQFSRRDRTPFQDFEKTPRPIILTIRRGDRVRIVAVSPQAGAKPAGSPATD